MLGISATPFNTKGTLQRGPCFGSMIALQVSVIFPQRISWRAMRNGGEPDQQLRPDRQRPGPGHSGVKHPEPSGKQRPAGSTSVQLAILAP